MSHFSSDESGQPLVLYEAFLQGLDVVPTEPVISRTNGVLSANIWPETVAFQHAAKAYWGAVIALSTDLLEAFALALGVDRNAFSRHFSKPISNISYLHYPPRPDVADGRNRPDPKSHRDTNALTILLPESGGWIAGGDA